MEIFEITNLAEKIAREYNPAGLSPFPFDKVEEANEELIIYNAEMHPSISGAIAFDKDKNKFVIYVNRNKPDTRQHFTTAHELGHYFLHKEIIRGEDLIVDGENSVDGSKILYRLDGQTEASVRETEANNFAASLIMPSELVTKAWSTLHSVEACAKVFCVSVSAMSVRLERLGLLR